MPTLRDLKGRPVPDPADEPDARDVNVVAVRSASERPTAPGVAPTEAPGTMPSPPGAVVDWKPWEQFKVIEPQLLPIAAPPCPSCEHWRPQRVYENGTYMGVRLCWTDGDQHADFSCFKPGVPHVR